LVRKYFSVSRLAAAASCKANAMRPSIASAIELGKQKSGNVIRLTAWEREFDFDFDFVVDLALAVVHSPLGTIDFEVCDDD